MAMLMVLLFRKNPNINKTKLKNFVNAATTLLTQQGYYTEKQLRIQYMKKDKNIKKKDAERLTDEYIAGVNIRVNAIKARVNKDTREEHGIPKAIPSGTVIYVLSKEDN